MLAPNRFWVAEKDGTAVKKFDTAGETRINLPDGIKSVSIHSAEDLAAVELDTSVLSDDEANALGVTR